METSHKGKVLTRVTAQTNFKDITLHENTCSKATQGMLPLREDIQTGQHTDSRAEAARDRGGGGAGTGRSVGMGFLFWSDDKVPELDSGDGCATLQCT